jgi:outer membrane receptor for ferrienterochelin and colicins
MEHWTTRIAFFMGLMMCASAVFGQRDADSLFTLSLEDLMKVKVTTASNKDEELGKAPATIIVITEEEINERGYFELYDVLNDLPGFDLSRAFGDDNYYAYVRGYRKTTSDQMLLMIDGIIMNHLFNNNMNAYAQYPLQNIKQIEIVYGPASAIYGPNAFTGVINLITKKEGISSVQTTFGQNNTSNIDIHLSQKIDDFTLNFSGRLYESDGPDLEGRTSAITNEVLSNPYYWGDFAKTDFTGYKSPIRSNFSNTSVGYKGLSVGWINFFYESGLGAEFHGGTSLNSGTWQFKENTFYGRYEGTVGKLSSKTLLKYRRSDIPGSSSFLYRGLITRNVDGYPKPRPYVDTVHLAPGEMITNINGNQTVTNNSDEDKTYYIQRFYQRAEYWQATNASFSFFQDFTYTANDNLVINFGLKYDRRFLNRDYKRIRNQYTKDYVYDSLDIERLNPLNDAIVAGTPFAFPDRPDDSTIDQENHNMITDKGIYVQAQYSPSDIITITGGLRYDYNSVWKGVVSPRIGLVIEPVSGLIGKLFFGTAFLEPSARVLYGGWSGSLSNDKLEPEKMRTFELSLAYTKNYYSFGLNGFYNIAPDAIGQDSNNVPVNLGSRRMFGGELNGKILLRNIATSFNKLRGDLYISYIKSQEDLGDTGDFTNTGNMAPIKIKAIITGTFWNNFSVSFQNRYISEIETVSTNPIRNIDGWFVTDTFIQYNDLLIKGLSVGCKIYNVFNADYFHPGYRNADAGEGSVYHALVDTYWYNSRLPQPERTFLFNMRYKF